jgi:hypothetical protein
VFFHRVRLAGELGLVDEEVVGEQHACIGGHQIPGGQAHHIARHQFAYRQFTRQAVAQHGGRDRHFERQLLGGATGPVGLHKVQRHAHQHDGADDEGAGHIAGEGRNAARHQQNKHQRVAEMRQKLQQHRALGGRLQAVGAVLFEPPGRFGPGQTRQITRILSQISLQPAFYMHTLLLFV